MATKAEDLLQKALSLPDGERAGLAAGLLASLDEPADDGAATVEAEWSAEIQRRVDAAMAGETRSEPWVVVRQRIADDLAG